jgi:hypothetical protein
MVASNDLHAPAALPTGKELSVRIGAEDGWTTADLDAVEMRKLTWPYWGNPVSSVAQAIA